MTATTNSNRPPTRDHLKKKQPSLRRIKITMSSDAAEELDRTEQAVQTAEFKIIQEDPPTAESQAALATAKSEFQVAKAAAEKDSVEFVFRALGRKPYDALVDAHPPTSDQKQIAINMGGTENDLQWNTETFPPALVAASIVEPPLSIEEVIEIWDSEDWAFNELQALFFTAMAANQARRVVDSGNA